MVPVDEATKARIIDNNILPRPPKSAIIPHPQKLSLFFLIPKSTATRTVETAVILRNTGSVVVAAKMPAENSEYTTKPKTNAIATTK